MNYNYYKTFSFLNKETSLAFDEIGTRRFYYRFYYEDKLSSYVGQRCHRGNFDIVYYTGADLHKICEFHLIHFEGINTFNLVQPMGPFTVLVKEFKNSNEFIRAEMYNYNSNFEQIESYQFDKDFKLLEYRNSFSEGDNIKSRVFLPYIWEILDDY